MAAIPIIVVRAGADVCRVVPPVNVARRGDDVEWRNRTGAPITVFFRAGIFDQNNPLALTIPDTQNASRCVIQNAPYGLFPYSIFCYVTNNNAIGNSDPEIIIDA
jgi:hypothetical protein